jgi:Plant protein of unknown function
MEQGVSEVEEAVTISIDSLQSQEPLTPQKIKMLLKSIECLQDDWSFQQIEPIVQTSTGSKHNEKPSIYPIGRFSSGFIRKNHFHSKDRDISKWGYVKFMTNWLRLDVKSYLRNLKEDLAWSYYGDQFHKFFNDYKYCDDNVPHFEGWSEWSTHEQERKQYFLEYLTSHSCFLIFSIILLQNIRNGTEILNDTSPTDLRSRHFSTLCQEIMQNQIKTKLSMLRLENQIPWFAVKAVFTNSNLSEFFDDTNIERLAISCFDEFYPRANKSKVQGESFPSEGFKHLLHIFHWTRAPEREWLVMDTKTKQVQTAKRFADFYIPNATNLLGSATSIKRLDTGAIDVAYSNSRISGQMEITPMYIFQYSREIFKNLLNFEQRYLECGLPVTAYLACMKNLLQTNADVELLHKNGIVQNTFKGEKDILDFVHYMTTILVNELNACVPSDLSNLSKEVNDHHEKIISRAYSELKTQFCPNRWLIFTIIGAIISIILFVLTFMQTIYTALGYYKSP